MTMKLCKDCIHVKPAETRNQSHKCLHPAAAISAIDYFDGSERLLHPSVDMARSGLSACGEDGKLWEPQVGFV